MNLAKFLYQTTIAYFGGMVLEFIINFDIPSDKRRLANFNKLKCNDQAYWQHSIEQEPVAEVHDDAVEWPSEFNWNILVSIQGTIFVPEPRHQTNRYTQDVLDRQDWECDLVQLFF